MVMTMGIYVIIDKSTKQVRSFVDGDINTVAISPMQEFIQIVEVPKLQKSVNYYKFVDGNFLYEQVFEDEEYNRNWRRLRASEYPSMADYLDGVVKGDQAQIQAYIDACLAVKAKYPKPSEG